MYFEPGLPSATKEECQQENMEEKLLKSTGEQQAVQEVILKSFRVEIRKAWPPTEILHIQNEVAFIYKHKVDIIRIFQS